MLIHSVSRVPPPKASSSHRILKPPQLYSSSSGASARATLVSVTRGVGAPTVVSFTVDPTAPRFPLASKGAHSRRCAGSVRACQTFSGEWRSSRTRMSVHFSSPFCPRSFRTCAPLAGPGLYCSRSIISFSLQLGAVIEPRRWSSSFATWIVAQDPRPTTNDRSALPVRQLGELNEVAASVVQHRNGRAGHIGGRHGELGAASLDPLVVALDVVGNKIGRGLMELKNRLLIRFGRGVVVQRQLQLGAVRFVGRSYSEPAKWALTEIGLLGEAQYLRIEAQGFVLVVHVYAGQFDFHFVSPLSGSRFGRVVFSLDFLFFGDFFSMWSFFMRS